MSISAGDAQEHFALRGSRIGEGKAGADPLAGAGGSPDAEGLEFDGDLMK